MNRPASTSDENDRQARSGGEATFLSDVQGAGTVSDGETYVAPRSPELVPGKTIVPGAGAGKASESFSLDVSSPPDQSSADQSSAGTAPTLVGQLHIKPQQAPFAGHAKQAPETNAADTRPDGPKTHPGTEKTFISQAGGIPDDPGATFIGAPAKKDSEDFFDTLQNEDSGKTDELRGFVIGDYQVLGELGRGGMGVVYKAKHRKLSRVVALKMILAGKHSGNEALERFIVEAQAVAKLQHPGIVQIFDIGEHEGLPYFSLEFVEGKDLQKDLNGLPRDPRRSAEMVEQLCIAMQYAHDHKILHRDLKPANVLLDKDGKPKITDFGLAKHVDADASGATNDGTIMGSPSYMPPEQARGDLSSMSPRSDLYSLGAILYQMLTARPPFVAERPLETVLQVISNEPVAPRDLQPGLPVDLETICMKALQKDPASRYTSCAELAADLRRFINGEPILARPVSRLERVWRWCRRNPRVAVPSGLAGVFIVSTALISTWAWNSAAIAAEQIAQERDNVKEQRDEAEKQKGIAEAQTIVAVANENKAREEQAEADRQRILAGEAKLQAEKNQKLAENQAMLALKNMQFIVTEIDDRLAKQPGMSELRIGMLEVVEKKWDELDVGLAGGIEGEAIATQMTVRYKIAESWMTLGRPTEADAAYEKIYKQGHERLLIKNRSDASRSNLALICLRWAPEKQRLTGDPADSDRLLQEGLTLLRDIIAHPLPIAEGEKPGPAKFEIAATLQQTLQQQASSRKKLGNLAEANALFQEAGEVSVDILKDFADNAGWVSILPEDRRPVIRSFFEQNLDISHTGQANVLCCLGKVDEAIPMYQAVIKSRRSGVEANPADRNAQDQLARQLANFGQYMLRCGRIDDAASALAEANSLADANFLADSTNANMKRTLGNIQYYLGTARDVQGLTPDAIVLFERSRVLRTELLAVSPDKSNKVSLMLAEARLGNSDAARALIEDLEKLEAKDPDLRLDLARSCAQLSRAAEGDAQSALVTQAIAALERSVDDGLKDPFPVSSEPDLIPLRDDERFKNVVAKLRNLEAQVGAKQPTE